MEEKGKSSKLKQLVQSTINPFGEKVTNLLGFRKWSIDTFPVRVVITGIEHSGTTLLSTLVKQDLRLSSGFECGFLLADCPRQFRDVHPWYEWMQEPVSAHQWGVSGKHLESICASKTWEEAYRRLLNYSPVFDQERQQQVCDKTPRYLSCLDVVLDKLPDFVPCLVIEKEVESLWRSHKKRNSSLEDFCNHFELYNNGLRRALQRHGERIYRVKYEALCRDLHEQLRNVFSIVHLPFKQEYALRHSQNLQEYHDKNSIGFEPLTKEEEYFLDNLRKRFADLSIT